MNQIAEFIRFATRRGWTLYGQRKHIKLKHPNGGIIVFAKTPGDRRSMRNAKAILLRIERRQTRGAGDGRG